jgi:hypothetical protein
MLLLLRTLIVWATSGLLSPCLLGQTPQPAPPAPAGPAPRVAVVEFDQNGFPLVHDAPERPLVQPPANAKPTAVAAPAAATAGANAAAAPAAATPRSPVVPLASGMAAGSPLLPVFQAVQAPGNFRRLGTVQVWWRITVHDELGAPIGMREVTHTADLDKAAVDRLEFHHDGRIYGRSGASVFAERQGRPWPTWRDSAAQELACFGLHLRAPWCFGDGEAFVVVAEELLARGSERMRRIAVERRQPADQAPIGPELVPARRDRFELWCDLTTNRPRELVHEFAFPGSGARRVLLDDWEEFEGVPLPRRRTYVDEQQRPTTVLQITNMQRVKASDRDFRLH